MSLNVPQDSSSGVDLGPAATRSMEYRTTDLGNAERFVAQHNQAVRYVHEWGKWYVWNGLCWSPDPVRVSQLAKQTVRSIYEDALREQELEKRRKVTAHAHASESEWRLRSMLSLAQNEPALAAKASLFLDVDPWLLSVRNGTLNLRTGELQPPRRGDYLTTTLPIDYDPDAACPTWYAFLDKIMDGNEDMIGYLQRAIGYALTGEVGEQKMFVCYGGGQNGKSTLLEAICTLLGEYAGPADPELLLSHRQEQHPTGIAKLAGKRFVTCQEKSGGRQLNETQVKWLTGNDRLTGRFMHRDFFDFMPTHKFWLAVNKKPRIRGTDRAIWDRIHLIPFNVTIPDEEKDIYLGQKLHAELSGILSWAAVGCLWWQEHGLGAPPQIQEATEAYRAESDTIAQFIAEMCIIVPTAKVEVSVLYKAYEKWCEEEGQHPEPRQDFRKTLQDRGFTNDARIGHEGSRGWSGIGLRRTDADN